jgi:hypothetical protein
MPTYLVMHVERVPEPGEVVTARVTITDGADQPGGFKAGAETLGSQSGVYALSALSNVTAKKVKRNPPTFTVEDL